MRRSDTIIGFRNARIAGRAGSARAPGFALPALEAHYRTRTDDPFLTMEVLYQLS